MGIGIERLAVGGRFKRCDSQGGPQGMFLGLGPTMELTMELNRGSDGRRRVLGADGVSCVSPLSLSLFLSRSLCACLLSLSLWVWRGAKGACQQRPRTVAGGCPRLGLGGSCGGGGLVGGCRCAVAGVEVSVGGGPRVDEGRQSCIKRPATAALNGCNSS